MNAVKKISIGVLGLALWTTQGWAASGSQDILREGLLGAGVGAISAGASGGKAGKGALIGAGTNVIGGALLDMLTGPSPSTQPVPSYYAAPQPAYQPAPQPVYAAPVETVYVQPQYVSAPPVAATNSNQQILKSGLLGAGTGAIAASASGGNAGKGALIGAGTNVIGGALLDMLTAPSAPAQQAPVYYSQPAYAPGPVPAPSALKKHVIRKYDSDGKVISEEEVWE